MPQQHQEPIITTMAKSFDDWVKPTFTLLGTFGNDTCKPYSIPMVPEELRKGNEKAHEPKVVSIGPRFKGRRELLPMEEIKMSCMRFLLQRSHFYSRSKGGSIRSIRSILEKCMSLVSTYEAAVRTSYAEDIELDSFDLATIVLQDACFLLELLISRSHLWETILEVDNTSPATELGNMELILRDITLLENQIPFFLLYTLFEQLFSDVIHFDRLRDNFYPGIMEELVLSLLGYPIDSSSKSAPHKSTVSALNRPINASHILELLHSFFILIEKNHQSQQCSSVVDIIDVDIGIDVNRQTKLNRCANRLLAA
ncbi:hypothetical protein Fmac_011477 [Flemingia macrophylla]|uniref:Uncharacterized protein n=1 Tax=Flemingia macrophylla TaxID=520843 RepID=A0ABD1MMJ9_9FABA